MKVLLVNGSPHRNGCTFTALDEVSKTLEQNGIETEIFQLGNKGIKGCIGCGVCRKKGECFMGDEVNEFAKKAEEADGFIFGTPVHYASASGALTSFLDRLFYSSSSVLRFKPAATVVSARRGGTTATFDQINKYAAMSNMPIVTSQYWNMVHGTTPDDVRKDLEGMQTMRILGNNMAWLLKCIELGKTNNVNRPELEEKIFTNFIR